MATKTSRTATKTLATPVAAELDQSPTTVELTLPLLIEIGTAIAETLRYMQEDLAAITGVIIASSERSAA
jgi:hypothetical protein